MKNWFHEERWFNRLKRLFKPKVGPNASPPTCDPATVCMCDHSRAGHRNTFRTIIYTNPPAEYRVYDSRCLVCVCEEFWGKGWMS